LIEETRKKYREGLLHEHTGGTASVPFTFTLIIHLVEIMEQELWK
jgi:hypothetical protein